ncbi:exosome complex component RRP43 [Exaiptasia diaphana]|uniref:Ribosomal RNA-processing protein 43 n=1 Tax=Exaiptasia diaphana TaxID=2652724 RepID=A0A913XBL3_EXADI|nr:exosome complex component RRP43 [Exaiptasia diaphana]KXJ26502.1 Exosome complex component RRP43 [Exaiptasia diaphana]
MAADFKTAEPLEYYRQFLKENIRPDGRGFHEFRETTLNIGSISTAEGSALVKLGNTTVVCGVKAELAEPKLDSPKQGYIVPNIDLPPLCSPHFRPGPPNEQAQVLNQFFADIITNSQMINLADLCIVEAKLVWALYVDMICLDYDGNVTDACMVAMLAALKNTRLYDITINEETETPEPSKTRDIALTLKSEPVASTFGIFDDTHLYADPTDEEEKISTGTVTVVVTKDEKLISVHKPGCSPMSNDKLQECFKQAIVRAREVHNLIETAFTQIDR